MSTQAVRWPLRMTRTYQNTNNSSIAYSKCLNHGCLNLHVAPPRSPLHIPHSRFHPQLRILLVRPPHKPVHRLSSRLAQALVKDTLESKLGVAFVDADLGGDLKEAVGPSHVLLEG